MAEEKRVEKERLKEVRAKERAKKEAKKEAQKALRDAQKAIQPSQSGNRKASQAHKPPKKRQKGSGDGAARVEAPRAAIAAPPKKTRTRTIQKPKKYSE